MANKCPYCGKSNCIKSRAFLHAVSYGGEGRHAYTDGCNHCGKMVSFILDVSVKASQIEKSDSPEGDWG